MSSRCAIRHDFALLTRRRSPNFARAEAAFSFVDKIVKDAMPNAAPDLWFAQDSALEEEGFEPSVPPSDRSSAQGSANEFLEDIDRTCRSDTKRGVCDDRKPYPRGV